MFICDLINTKVLYISQEILKSVPRLAGSQERKKRPGEDLTHRHPLSLPTYKRGAEVRIEGDGGSQYLTTLEHWD